MLLNKHKIKTAKILIYSFYIVAGLAYFKSYGFDVSGYSIGRLLGVLGLSGLALQTVLSSRNKMLEAGIGLDRLSRWHKANARATTLFVILHPLLLFYTYVSKLNFSFISAFTLFHYFGVASLIGVLFIVATALYSVSLKFKYETWKIVHKLTYAILITAFVHGFFISGNILYVMPLGYWWEILLAITILSFLAKYTSEKKIYNITKIKQETPNVRSVFLKPKDTGIDFKPGQFAFLTFTKSKVHKEEHPFTISAMPDKSGDLSFSIKESGDFTRTLSDLRVGDRAIINGPYGTFSNYDMKGPFIFIIGGIGITPAISMIKYMAAQKSKDRVILLYANRTQKDIAFFDDLELIQNSSDFLRVVHVLSEERTNIYKYGIISKELLESELDYISFYKYFICGPAPMMRSIKNTLLKLGARSENIFTEEFALK